MGDSESDGRRDGTFPSTSWSVIRHAQDPGSPEYERHLRRLIELYWKPVYLVIRHSWARNEADAKDQTQEFFASVVLDHGLVRSFAPERGSFRAFLRSAVVSFMLNVKRDAGRQKRGGGFTMISLDDADTDLADAIPDPGARTPEELFDAAWNQVVMAQAIELVGKRLVAENKGFAFEIFKRYDLELERKELSYAALGQELGLSAAQVKHALLHARATLRDVVTDVVRGYVDGPVDLARELQSLFGG